MTIWLWGGFLAFVFVMMALDLIVVGRGARVISVRVAVGWTLVCIAAALGFAVAVYYMYEHNWLGIAAHLLAKYPEGARPPSPGREGAMQFLTGWIVEYSLSLDNLMVFAVIFAYFRVPAEHQRRVLFWGILGAIILRGIMIGAGVALIQTFHWVVYIFGAILLLTALKLLWTGDEKQDLEKGLMVRLVRSCYPVSPAFDGDRFFTRFEGRRAMTPLFLVLLVVDLTDVIFAFDSIPAIFSITTDPFLVFTSNIFAILGLRSLYFALAAMMDKFRYVKVSLVFVLAFLGVKMLTEDLYEMPTVVSLPIIGGILSVGLVASAFASRRERLRRRPPIDDLALGAELAWRRARRVVILVLGLTIIFIIAPLAAPIPGPGGIPVAIAGLALLATEFIWARRLLTGLKQRAMALAAQADAFVGAKPSIWPVPLMLISFAVAVGGLIWWEPRWWPMICLGASGPGMAVGYWTVATTRKWSAQRRQSGGS